MSRKFVLLLRDAGYIKLIVYMIILSSRILTADSQLSNIVEKSRKLITEEETTLSDDPNSSEINLSVGEDEEAEPEVDDPKKFSWKNHQDDHSIYAHRSLMSAANIERPNLAASDSSDGNGVYENDDGVKKPNNNNNSIDDEELAPLRTVDFAEKEWQLMFRSFDLMFDGVSASLIQELGQKTNLLNEIIARLKPECRRDINHMRRSLKQHKLWALRMVDSIGKIPSGITYGKFSSPGDWEECLSVRVDEQVHVPTATNQQPSVKPIKQTGNQKYNNNRADFSVEQHKFHGKYCLIDFRLPLPERPTDKLLSIHDPIIDLAKTDVGQQFPELQNFSGYASVFYEVGYMHAVCLPSTCDVNDLTRSIGQALEGLHIIVNSTVDCQERPDERPAWRTSQLISASLLIVLFANAGLASVMRYFCQKQLIAKKKQDLADHHHHLRSAGHSKPSGWHEWATKLSTDSKIYSDCFSIQTNFERLSKPDPRGLTFVHYTRIVAMALTVITHTAGLGTLQAITKPADASNSEQIFRDFIPQMLANAFTSIQIFFFMAGFMLVISTYPSINREKGHVSFVEYAIKRAIRLMPGLAATICINFLWPLVVDGPMLSYFYRLIVVPCEINWWRTMAFLSNFDHVEKMCLRHSYFSASDYQLHIVAFPLLILLYKQPNLSLIIAGILTCAGFVAQVIMILTKTVIPFMMVDYIDKQAFFNVVHYIHHPSWNHMSAFFYGFIIGYLVVKQVRINLSEKTIKRLWYTILPLGIASIFAPYFWNHYKRPIYRWQMVLYVLFDRFALLTACAWLSYATMVLGRKPAAKSTTVNNNSKSGPEETNKNGQKNLPNIVALASAHLDKLESESPIANPPVAEPSSQRVDLNNTWTSSLIPPPDKLQTSTTSLNTGTSNMTRQRSSPNFQAYCKQLDNQSAPSTPTLRPAISSSDVHSEATAKAHAAAGKQQSSVAAELDGRPQEAASSKQQERPRRAPAAISNVNTLCLILSRLTFQLYLFNMVVLWIDVNHSKYYWFFSYYFIITKATAIYICSSLMALVFFVTLESPSLTLYIMWVKSRAQTRADRGEETAAAAAAAAKEGKSSKPPNKSGSTMILRDQSKESETYASVSSKPRAADLFRPANGQSYLAAGAVSNSRDQVNGSSDGLNMRMGSPINRNATIEKPTFSYIDLSSPSSTETHHVPATATATSSFTGTSTNTATNTTTTNDTLQTKM